MTSLPEFLSQFQNLSQHAKDNSLQPMLRFHAAAADESQNDKADFTKHAIDYKCYRGIDDVHILRKQATDSDSSKDDAQ